MCVSASRGVRAKRTFAEVSQNWNSNRGDLE